MYSRFFAQKLLQLWLFLKDPADQTHLKKWEKSSFTSKFKLNWISDFSDAMRPEDQHSVCSTMCCWSDPARLSVGLMQQTVICHCLWYWFSHGSVCGSAWPKVGKKSRTRGPSAFIRAALRTAAGADASCRGRRHDSWPFPTPHSRLCSS